MCRWSPAEVLSGMGVDGNGQDKTAPLAGIPWRLTPGSCRIAGHQEQRGRSMHVARLGARIRKETDHAEQYLWRVFATIEMVGAGSGGRHHRCCMWTSMGVRRDILDGRRPGSEGAYVGWQRSISASPRRLPSHASVAESCGARCDVVRTAIQGESLIAKHDAASARTSCEASRKPGARSAASGSDDLLRHVG